MFCTTLTKSFLEPKFLFLPTLAFLFESSDLNCEFIYKKNVFLINSKILFMSSGEKPILTLKISVTNF